jgi:hypothetical protein
MQVNAAFSICSIFFQDWSGIVDQSQAGGDQYHVGDFIYVMPAESTGNVSDVKFFKGWWPHVTLFAFILLF